MIGGTKMLFYPIDGNVSLKLIEMKDAIRVFELINKSRPYLRQWLPWLDSTMTVEDTKAFIQGCLHGYVQNHSMTTAILYKGEIVGIAGFNSISWENMTTSIGYWLGEGYQGKGIMTKVAKALTNYAFTYLQLNKVEIRAAEGNKKSRSIPERLGFIIEGKIRQAEWLYDHYVDHIVYGILASEWSGKRI